MKIHSIETNMPEKKEAEEDNFRESELYKLMKPLLIIMKLGAVYFEPVDPKTDQTTRRKANPWKVYCYSILVFDILNLFRITSTFWIGSEDYQFVVKFVVYSMVLQLPFDDIAFIKISGKGLVRTFIKNWETLQDMKRAHCGVQTYKRSLEKLRVILIVPVVFCIIALLGQLGFIFIGDSSLQVFRPLIAPISKDHPQAKMFLLLQMFTSMWSFTKFLGMAFFVGFFAYSIYREFYIFLEHFEKAVSSEGGFKGSFEAFRLWHTKICDLTLILDETMKAHITIIYAQTIPCIFMVIYTLLNTTHSSFMMITMLAYLMVSFLFGISLLAAGIIWINHPAHLPLEYAYRIDLSRLRPGEADQVSLFVSRLTGPPIGLTALDLFTLDKPMVLTLFGTIVAYTVVVYQMAPTNASAAVALTDNLVEEFRNGTQFTCNRLS